MTIENAFKEEQCKLWNVRKNVSLSTYAQDMPCPDVFSMFRNLSLPCNACYFDNEYEKSVIVFLNDYDKGTISKKKKIRRWHEVG